MDNNISLLKQRIEELEKENKHLKEILQDHNLLPKQNKQYPLHEIWLEDGKYEGV